MLDALIVVSSDPRYDARSTKFLNSLLEAGLKARVIGTSSDNEAEETEAIIRVPVDARGGKKFFLQFYGRIVPRCLNTPAKVVIAGDLFSLPPAILAKRKSMRFGIQSRLIYDSKELYRELPSLKRKKSSFLFWMIVENQSIKRTDRVLTVNESIAEILEVKWHLPVTVVMNVPESSVAITGRPKSLDRIFLAFSGGLQPERGLENLIRLVSLLPRKYEIRFVGDGSMREELERLAQKLDVGSRVHFVGRVKNSEVIDRLSQSHVGIYLMENTGLCHYLALPNKLFQFLSAGLPVIVPTFPEMEKIVRKYDVGKSVDPKNLEEAARAVVAITSDAEVYRRYVANCEKAARELNWRVEKDKFVKVVKELI